ncbi:MAG: caspase family protein [Myxococcota bacterium]
MWAWLLAPLAMATDADSIGICGYRALLIGVEAYADPDINDLDTPHEDIAALSQTLADRYGVQTEVLEDPNRRALLDALDGLRTTTRECEAVIVYFAGHGIYDEAADEGYWLPSDADENSRATWISNADVASGVNALEARHVLLVSDSCFAGSLFRTRGIDVARSGDAATQEASRLARDRSRWVLTSGGNEPVVDQYRDGLSVFAYFLRQQLSTVESRFVVVDALFPQIRSLVVANAAQTPRQGPFRGTGHEGGQLVLVNRDASANAGLNTAVFTAPPASEGPAQRDSRPEAPAWWVAGIVLGLGAFGVGGLFWLLRRSTAPPDAPASPTLRGLKRQTYQGLWNRIERLHVDLRRGQVDPEDYAKRVGDVNAFVIERGLHIEPDDAALIDRYLKGLVRLKEAASAAGDDAEADFETTGAFQASVLQDAPELASVDEEVRGLREALRQKVQSLYAEP